MVSRNGGDAGTAIHTSVPFENPANMTLAFPVDRFGRRRLEVPPAPAKGCRARLPGAESGGGSDHTAKVCAFLIRECPKHRRQKYSRLGAVIGFSPIIHAGRTQPSACSPGGVSWLLGLEGAAFLA
jgi:hypothetical protein